MVILFKEFVEKKTRQAKRKLGIIKKMFEMHDIKIKDNLDEVEGFDELEPYLFVFNPQGGTTFEGVRVYSIGGEIAFRAQRDFDTHPFGRAYHIDVEKIFDGLMENEKNEEDAAKGVIDGVVQEVKAFFKKSEKSQKDAPLMTTDPLNQVYMRSTGTDYANKVTDISKR